MKRLPILLTALAGILMLSLATPAMAAKQSKEKTITGEAKCAKCALKESDKCQTVIQTAAKGGKTVNYYIADNDAAKAFHKNICSGPKKATATGTVKKTDGKHELTATKIDLVK